MLTQCLKPFTLLLAIILGSLHVRAQSDTFEDLVFTNDSLNSIYPREKIFIHHDKPYYKLRDTIWLKGYLFTGPVNIPNDSSRFAYVEIINTENEVVRRISTPCVMGLFAANIALHDKIFKQGEYRMRAYTRYMMNFGDSLFFETSFLIIDPAAEEWNTKVRELKFADNRLLLSATLLQQNTALADRVVTIRLRSKNKTLFRIRARTSATGTIYIDTLLKDADKQNLRLEITDRDDIKLQLPVTHEKGLIDLQFLPEGGTFIAGKTQKLGFKAINVFGKGVDIKGIIKDSKGTIITNFASIHKGMGIVYFTPQTNEQYTAVLEDGSIFNLPAVQTSGFILQIINEPATDSIQLRIDGSFDMQNRVVYFVANTRGITAARGRVILTPKGFELKISKQQLLGGITVFTLYNERLQPVNSRAVFIHHNNDLKLKLTSHKPEYNKKDSVSLTLNVQNEKNEPVIGSFSMAVLDSSQVRTFPDAENLLSYMMLSSELKGEIEDPYYYFKNPDPSAAEALMLTQGWISYARTATVPLFDYERDFTVTGKVSNIFNKAVSNAKLTLFGKSGKSNAFVRDTLTNSKGSFSFSRFPYYETDSISMVIMAVNKKGKAFNVGIELEEPSYPAVNTTTRSFPQNNILIDTIARAYISSQEKIKTELLKEGVVLSEVVVKTKSRIPGSKNLNKDGEADQVITEETLNKTPKQTLLKILQDQIIGFRLGSPIKSRILLYMINSNIVRLVIDGIDVHFFFSSFSGAPNEYQVYLDTYLKYFFAEDIKGIEVMNSRSNGLYRAAYLTMQEQIASSPATYDFSFIEITTHSGQGPLQKKTPGRYLLKPVYPVLSKQFYSPRYTSSDEKSFLPDLRSTVYWNQDIVTDKHGNVNLSFYTSESNSSYMIIVQGTDLKGNFGILHQPLYINRKQAF